MAGVGPLTSADLAEKTGKNKQYVHEWLAVQVFSGYITYDIHTRRHMLSKEHALVVADEIVPILQ
jgi:DNA-binding IclR family transcriptional regulator